MLLKPTTDTVWQRVLRGALLLVVCGLCGTFDILNNNFARWVARVASFPEEEEHHSKDRSALVAAGQPSRRGTIRPPSGPGGVRDAGPRAARSSPNAKSLPRAATTQLTGAGIFQHC